MPDGVRTAFLQGRCDAATELPSGKEEIARTASRLPYFNNFASSNA